MLDGRFVVVLRYVEDVDGVGLADEDEVTKAVGSVD